MPSKPDPWLLTRVGAIAFLGLHAVGLAVYGWSVSHPTLWIALTFLLGRLGLHALPDGYLNQEDSV